MYKTFRRGVGKNGGFSLIELIIVVAILAVLVALLAPQYFQYVEKSRKGVCENNRAEVERAYKIACADIEETDTGTALMQKILLLNGATASGANFEGLCPDGGKIVIRGGDKPYLLCDKHSEMVSSNEEAAVELKAALDKMNQALTEAGNDTFNGTLYSGVPSNANDGYSDFYASLSNDAREYLVGKTWRVESTGTIYIYDGDISSLTVDMKIQVEVYDANGNHQTKTGSVGTKWFDKGTVNEQKYRLIGYVYP